MTMVAIFLVATIVVSCGRKLDQIDSNLVENAPTQVVKDMEAIQTQKGMVKMRMRASVMERYEDNDGKKSEEIFKNGFNVMIFNEEGKMETQIISNEANHSVVDKTEKWSAYGNVVINNYIKGEVIKTDTLYWDKDKKLIYTHCYVTLSSPQGFMQGFGLESDEMARRAQLLRPFDSYGVVDNDSTRAAYVDSVNFIGPK